MYKIISNNKKFNFATICSILYEQTHDSALCFFTKGAGGVGKEIAESLINGESTQEVLPFNIQRFLDLHNNKQYLQQRVKEVVGRNYTILYPHQSEYKYARKLRCSPLYSVLEERGAIFGVKMAYERPLYFDSTYRRKFQQLSRFLYY